MYVLDKNEFRYISERIYDYAKISITEKKKSLVVSRLSKRIRALKLDSFKEYIDYLENRDDSGKEFEQMVNSLSTNFSSFFRESYHTDYLASQILPKLNGQSINIWSAAASTGQEIYSILITIKEYERESKKRIDYNLFASDISSRALTAACRGVFQKKEVTEIDDKFLKRYFLSGTGNQSELVKIKKELVKKINFFKLNLMDSSYKLPVMDIIFLRNAIIYFDRETKIRLINRIYNYIKPGGFLFLGHSESLTGISDRFQLIGKTIYRRVN